MSVTLVATVGTGRNREDVAEAIVFSLREHGADRAVFLCSRKTKVETLPFILKRLGWDVERYRVDVCHDEDDVQGLFVEWSRRWDGWFTGWPESEVVVDFTSGTKPMSAAAFALAIGRDARRVSYVRGPRDQTGRAVESTKIQSLAPTLVTAHRQLRLAIEHFGAGSFAAARDIAAAYASPEALPDDHLAERARSIHRIAEAYEAWDRFDYTQAQRGFRASRRHWEHWTWIESEGLLRSNYELVQAAEKSRCNRDFGPALCADLLGSVDRCRHRGAWDDAVARLYRACEMLAQLKLLRDHGQRTGDIDPERLPEPPRGRYVQRKAELSAKRPGARLKVGLADSYTLLEDLGDRLGTKFRARYGEHPKWGPLQGALQRRNDSLLAHGTTPIQRDPAVELHEHVIELAKVADPAIVDHWLPKARPVRFRPM